MPSPSGSSNPVARLQAQGLASRRWRPFLTIKDRQKRLGDKFCRRQNFLVSQLASCGHLRPCKLPWMQVCFLGLQAFSTLCQSVDFVNILGRRMFSAARQSADTANNRKNCPDKNKIGCNFCFRRQLHLHPAVTYVYVSSLGCKYSFLGWICRALRDRQIQSPSATNFAAGKISLLAGFLNALPVC